MTPITTRRQPSRRKVAPNSNVDPAIYLRTYEVINSLDRAEHAPWWDKTRANFERTSHFIQRLRTGLVSVAEAGARKMADFKAKRGETPVLTRGSAASPTKELALTPVVDDRAFAQDTLAFAQDTLEGLAQQPRSVSWVVLAVVAALTAGLTFAIIHFAWSTSATGAVVERSRHAAIYIARPAVALRGQLYRALRVS